jgi:sulfopyruvate decarboxylase subunit alpha
MQFDLAASALAPQQRADAFLNRFLRHGYDCFSGVPCSLLAHLFALIEGGHDAGRLWYVKAVREDAALGVAVGLTVGGRRPVVLMQNSGLGYCLNVLTSLVELYEIPFPLVISWRGHDDTDAVEHTIVGKALTPLLRSIDMPMVVLDPADPESTVDKAVDMIARERKATAILVRNQL